jgi:hypothetical protein
VICRKIGSDRVVDNGAGDGRWRCLMWMDQDVSEYSESGLGIVCCDDLVDSLSRRGLLWLLSPCKPYMDLSLPPAKHGVLSV